jgi:hypothetical protein
VSFTVFLTFSLFLIGLSVFLLWPSSVSPSSGLKKPSVLFPNAGCVTYSNPTALPSVLCYVFLCYIMYSHVLCYIFQSYFLQPFLPRLHKFPKASLFWSTASTYPVDARRISCFRHLWSTIFLPAFKFKLKMTYVNEEKHLLTRENYTIAKETFQSISIELTTYFELNTNSAHCLLHCTGFLNPCLYKCYDSLCVRIKQSLGLSRI